MSVNSYENFCDFPKIKVISQQNKLNHHVSVFKRSLIKSESWVAQMHRELEWMHADGVYHLLRAVLHAIRDQLSVDENAHFSAQLPLVLRGTYFECWNPSKKNVKTKNKEEFLKTIQEKLGRNAEHPRFDIEQGTQVALNVIMNHISFGEMNDVINSLKPSLKVFFNKLEGENVCDHFS